MNCDNCGKKLDKTNRLRDTSYYECLVCHRINKIDIQEKVL